MLIRWEATASRIGGTSEGETALASSGDLIVELSPVGGTSTMSLWSDISG